MLAVAIEYFSNCKMLLAYCMRRDFFLTFMVGNNGQVAEHEYQLCIPAAMVLSPYPPLSTTRTASQKRRSAVLRVQKSSGVQ